MKILISIYALFISVISVTAQTKNRFEVYGVSGIYLRTYRYELFDKFTEKRMRRFLDRFDNLYDTSGHEVRFLLRNKKAGQYLRISGWGADGGQMLNYFEVGYTDKALLGNPVFKYAFIYNKMPLVADSGIALGMQLADFAKKVDTSLMKIQRADDVIILYNCRICIEPCADTSARKGGFDNHYNAFLFKKNKLVRFEFSKVAIVMGNYYFRPAPFTYKELVPREKLFSEE
jgi:hypothetical protein